MAFEPPNPAGAFQAFQQISGTGGAAPDGFAADIAPSVSGFGTRQSRIQNERPAVTTRNIMHWLIPEGPIVQMYMNPQNITYGYKKGITPQRTKGGFVVQYWGEELSTLKLIGTTGSSGIEGINVLYDVYRNEQLSLDPYALFLAAQNDTSVVDGGTIGSSIVSALGGSSSDASIGGAVGGFLTGAATSPSSTRPRPSLAYLAFTVEVYWSGSVYRGYFTDFVVTESVENLGMFNYDISFTVTQQRGFRSNFLPHHRAATVGPSNSDPNFGIPHSYGSVVLGDTPTPQRTAAPADILTNISNSFGGF